VPVEDKAIMPALEAEVHLVREFKDDVEVEQQVRGLILDLDCTRTRDSKFYQTRVVLAHKNDGSLGMLPKDEDFFQLKSSMELLENPNTYLLDVVTWM
jgi:hypothetical protein